MKLSLGLLGSHRDAWERVVRVEAEKSDLDVLNRSCQRGIQLETSRRRLRVTGLGLRRETGALRDDH